MHTPTAPALETGWSPTTPAGDTVHRRFVLGYAENTASVAVAAGGRLRRGAAFVAGDVGRPAGLYNAAVLTQPLDRVPEALDELERFYAADGTGTVLLWSPWPTPDLHARGWELEGHPPLLIRPPGGPLPVARADVDVAEVTDPEGVDEVGRVVVDGFPLVDLQPYTPGGLLPSTLLADPRWRLWIARLDGAAVAAGALFVSHGIAHLALAATTRPARGRGAWYALVRARLLAAPDLLSGGVFSDDSRPGIERLGYLPVVRFTLWRRRRP